MCVGQYVDSSRVHSGMMGGRRRLTELRATIRLKKAQRKHNKVKLFYCSVNFIVVQCYSGV